MLRKRDKKRIKNQYGPWALITGASSGIGEALAMDIAACHLNLIVVGRNTSKLTSLAKQLTVSYQIQVKVITLDLSTPEANSTLLDQIQDIEVGLLVASAGFGTSGSFLRTSALEEVNMLRVNCESLLVLTHHFAQDFARRGKGGIILMSSMLGFNGAPLAANYAATKNYVQSLAEALAVELKPKGVDVLAAAPGPVKTGFEARANMQMNMTMTPQQVAAPILKALGKKSTVLPGSLTKFLVYSLRTAPRWGRVRILKVVLGGMTKQQITS